MTAAYGISHTSCKPIEFPIPLYDKMITAKNFQRGRQTLRQIGFGRFDRRLHSEFVPAESSKPFKPLLDAVRKEAAKRSGEPRPDTLSRHNGMTLA